MKLILVHESLQSSQNFTVVRHIDCRMTRGNMLINSSLHIKEQNEHNLIHRFCLMDFLLYRRLQRLLIHFFSFCDWIEVWMQLSSPAITSSITSDLSSVLFSLSWQISIQLSLCSRVRTLLLHFPCFQMLNAFPIFLSFSSRISHSPKGYGKQFSQN